MNQKIILGQKYKDPVTGFTGTAISRIEYMWGCVQYELLPYGQDKEGKNKPACWFDESRIVNMEDVPAQADPSRGGPPPSSLPEFSHP